MFLRRSVTFMANSSGNYLSVEKTQSQSKQWLTSPPSNDAMYSPSNDAMCSPSNDATYIVGLYQRCKVNHNKEDFDVWIETKPDAAYMQLNDFVLCHEMLART